MAEYAPADRRAAASRSPDPPRKSEALPPGADRLETAVNANPAARAAGARGDALSLARAGRAAAPAIQMKSGPVAQMTRSKQEKNKARAEGAKKSKEKKKQKLVDTMVAYQTGNKKATRQEIEEAVVEVQKEKRNMRTGHQTQDSSHKMNQGTKDTRDAVNEKLREKKEKK